MLWGRLAWFAVGLAYKFKIELWLCKAFRTKKHIHADPFGATIA
jgi:hypothetical protein